jgi:DNA-binding MarR family transcriptional regulator
MGPNEDEWAPMEHPGHYLSRISRGLTRIGDARLRPLGLATAQLPVLSMLRNGERLSQAELAKAAKVEQPTMAQLLTRMERDGLIRREPDPRDRRSSLVMLTDAARERLPAGRQVLREGNAEMTRGLSTDEVAMLVGLLRRVLDNVEAMQPERRGPDNTTS